MMDRRRQYFKNRKELYFQRIYFCNNELKTVLDHSLGVLLKGGLWYTYQLKFGTSRRRRLAKQIIKIFA